MEQQQRRRTSRITHRGPVFDVEVIEFEAPDGRAVRRDIARHPGAVTIIPVDERGRLIMIENHRISVERTLLEFPAGKLEDGEEPAKAAARELVEETGYRAANLEPLGVFLTSPGMSDEWMHAFLATGLSEVGQQLEAGEHITVRPMTVEEFDGAAAAGEIIDGKTLAAMYLWRNRDTSKAGASPMKPKPSEVHS